MQYEDLLAEFTKDDDNINNNNATEQQQQQQQTRQSHHRRQLQHQSPRIRPRNSSGDDGSGDGGEQQQQQGSEQRKSGESRGSAGDKTNNNKNNKQQQNSSSSPSNIRNSSSFEENQNDRNNTNNNNNEVIRVTLPVMDFGDDFGFRHHHSSSSHKDRHHHTSSSAEKEKSGSNLLRMTRRSGGGGGGGGDQKSNNNTTTTDNSGVSSSSPSASASSAASNRLSLENLQELQKQQQQQQQIQNQNIQPQIKHINNEDSLSNQAVASSIAGVIATPTASSTSVTTPSTSNKNILSFASFSKNRNRQQQQQQQESSQLKEDETTTTSPFTDSKLATPTSATPSVSREQFPGNQVNAAGKMFAFPFTSSSTTSLKSKKQQQQQSDDKNQNVTGTPTTTDGNMNTNNKNSNISSASAAAAAAATVGIVIPAIVRDSEQNKSSNEASRASSVATSASIARNRASNKTSTATRGGQQQQQQQQSSTSSTTSSKSGLPYYENTIPSLESLPEFYPLERTLENSYRQVRKISEGTYGEVFCAKVLKRKEIEINHDDDAGETQQQGDQQQEQDQSNKNFIIEEGEEVAVKKIKYIPQLEGFPLTSIREIAVLKHLATLPPERRKYFSVTRDVLMGKNFRDTYLVFDFVDHSLHGLLNLRHTGGTTVASWSFGSWQILMLELCRGLKILHEIGIIHRDIKTNNVLVSKNGTVKLCDFGLAIGIDNERQNLTPSLIALDFRPPEMLLGSRQYDCRVDVWSVGCLLVQVFVGRLPFQNYQLKQQQQQQQQQNQNQQQQQQHPQNQNRHQLKAQTEFEQVKFISKQLNVDIKHMMRDTDTIQRCKKLPDIVKKHETETHNRSHHSHPHQQQYNLSQRRVSHPSSSSHQTTSSSSSFHHHHRVLLPGRSAPKNEHFEMWLRNSYDAFLQTQQRRYQSAVSGSSTSFQHSSASNAGKVSLDPQLIDVVVWMLQPDPKDRPSMQQVLEHPFFVSAQREERFSLPALQRQLGELSGISQH